MSLQAKNAARSAHTQAGLEHRSYRRLFERGNADVGQRQDSCRERGLGLPVAKLVVRSLELPPDADFGRVEFDVRPGEPECFAKAQAEDEDRHVSRVQRILVAPSGFQESAGLIDGPPLSVPFPGLGSRTTAALRGNSSSAKALRVRHGVRRGCP